MFKLLLTNNYFVGLNFNCPQIHAFHLEFRSMQLRLHRTCCHCSRILDRRDLSIGFFEVDVCYSVVKKSFIDIRFDILELFYCLKF